MEDSRISEGLTPNIVIVSKVKSLSSMKGIMGSIDQFSQKHRNDTTEGTPMGEFRGDTFMNVFDFLAPDWNGLSNRWFFEGDVATLARLVEQLGLRYPRRHPREGEMIRVEQNIDRHLTNPRDPIFQNVAVISKVAMKNGKVTLHMSNPLHEFIYRTMQRNRYVIDETNDDGKRPDIFAQAGARYKMITTKKKDIRKREGVNQRLEAMGMLAKLTADESRLRALCTLARVPGYSSHTDINGMVVLIEEQIMQNSLRPVSEMGGKPFIDVLLHYMQLPADQLKYEFDVASAIRKAIIRVSGSGFSVQGEAVNGPKTFREIVSYYTNPDNQERYIQLLQYLDRGAI